MERPQMSPPAQSAFVACIVLPLLALVVFVLRVKSRWMSQARLKADDYTMGAALLITMGTCATLAYALFIGVAMGSPQTIEGDSVVLAYEFDVIIEQLYGIAEALIKIAILLFYRRIFSTGRFPLVANLSIALTSVWALLFLLLFIFPVWPISTSWIPGQKSHLNYDWTKVLLWHSITNIALDVYVLVLPLPVIRRLHMSRSRRTAVASVLGLGSFCVIAACIRLSYVVGVQSERVEGAGTGTDAVSEAGLWSVIEPCCSVIAGCLPTLGSLLKGTRAAEWFSGRLRSFFPRRSSIDFMGTTFINNGSMGSSIFRRKASAHSGMGPAEKTGGQWWRLSWTRRKDTKSLHSSASTVQMVSTHVVTREMSYGGSMV